MESEGFFLGSDAREQPARLQPQSGPRATWSKQGMLFTLELHIASGYGRLAEQRATWAREVLQDLCMVYSASQPAYGFMGNGSRTGLDKYHMASSKGIKRELSAFDHSVFYIAILLHHHFKGHIRRLGPGNSYFIRYVSQHMTQMTSIIIKSCSSSLMSIT